MSSESSTFLVILVHLMQLRQVQALQDQASSMMRAQNSECQTELVELKARLAELPATDDGDVSDFELEKTLFDIDSLRTPGTSDRPGDDYSRLDKPSRQDFPSSQESATCVDPTQSLYKSMLMWLRSTLVRLFSARAQCMQLL